MPRAAPKTDLELVLAALADAEAYPAEGHTDASRAMLAAGLPHALQHADGQETHEFQKGLVRLAEAALAEARKTAEAALGRATAQAKEAEDRHALAAVAVSEAEEVSAGKREELGRAADALKAVQAEVAEAEEYFKGLEDAKDAVLVARAEHKGRKQEADAAATALEKFDQGELQESPVEQVLAFLREAKAEKALLASAPHALALKPDERRWFDNVTIQEIRQVLAEAVAAADERLAAGAEEEADAVAEALGAWAILDVTRERVAEAEHAHSSAKRARKNAECDEELARTEASVDTLRAATCASLVQQTLEEEKIKELDRAMAALARCAQPRAAPPVGQAAGGAEDVEMPPAEAPVAASKGADHILGARKVDPVASCEMADPATLGA